MHAENYQKLEQAEAAPKKPSYNLPVCHLWPGLGLRMPFLQILGHERSPKSSTPIHTPLKKISSNPPYKTMKTRTKKIESCPRYAIKETIFLSEYQETWRPRQETLTKP